MCKNEGYLYFLIVSSVLYQNPTSWSLNHISEKYIYNYSNEKILDTSHIRDIKNLQNTKKIKEKIFDFHCELFCDWS